MYKHILVSTDGSEFAMKGIEHALGLAREIGSEVTVITVAQPYPLRSAITQNAWDVAQKANAEEALRLSKTAAQMHGVKASSRVETNSSAADAILNIARSLECDLIVMASHGRRGVKRLLLGSQTSEVVRHSTIPVLVVR